MSLVQLEDSSSVFTILRAYMRHQINFIIHTNHHLAILTYRTYQVLCAPRQVGVKSVDTREDSFHIIRKLVGHRQLLTVLLSTKYFISFFFSSA